MSILLPPHMYSDDVVETNMGAMDGGGGGGEMYAEVSEAQRMKANVSAAQLSPAEAYLTPVDSQ